MVKTDDRLCLRFLWSDLLLRFSRVYFGISCAPYMPLKTIDTHLGRYESLDFEMFSKIRAGIYMDDICTTSTIRQKAEEEINRMTEMFEDVNMRLHKSRLSGDSSPDSSVLGMIWRTSTDKLALHVRVIQCPTTKSELLSEISKTFGPLDTLAPWLIRSKVLFPSLWMEAPSTKWEDPPPRQLQKEVHTWWKNSSGCRVWASLINILWARVTGRHLQCLL